MTRKAQAIKEKRGEFDFVKVKALPGFEGHYQESGKTTYRMGDDIFNSYI